MNKPFDMQLFLSGVLTGSHLTQHRHLSQARAIQKAIQSRWKIYSPWAWQLKHLHWVFDQYLKDHSDATVYYYRLTALLIWRRLGYDRGILIKCLNRG